MSKTLFLSYGRDLKNPSNVNLVLKFKSDLEKKGFIVLMDIDRLHVGDDWQIQLERDISQSDWILFFITPYSARRPDGYCLNELSYALYLKKSIIPVMVDFIEPPLSICRIQYLDFQNINNEVTYEEKIGDLIAVLNKEKELGFEGEQSILLKNLDPLKFDSVISKHIHGFIGREWVYEKVNYWLEDDLDSRILWITAEAGYGKSALATYLSETHPSSTSIHYCQHDAKATQDPKNILKTFIFELSTQLPDYREKLHGINITDKMNGSAADIFRELLEEPLLALKKPVKDLFFIIDALDEAKESDGKNPIIDLILNHFSNLPKWLNIILTSRPEPDLIRKLMKFNPLLLRADEENNLNDLKKYIHSRYADKLSSSIIQALINKSEGNILYLKMMLDNNKLNSFSEEDIVNLPLGMEGFYLQYFERMFNDSDLYEHLFLPFVNILIASEEGLPSSLVKYILNISERDYKKLIAAFGSLIEDNYGVVTFYHKSLFDWLADYDLSGDYSADLEAGNQLLVNKLWELYVKNNESSDFRYEPYLLRALYRAKAYKQLENILKDILVIGRVYNDKIEEIYKKILSLTIQNYTQYVDVKSLMVYASFIREKEYHITKVNEKSWKPQQTLFQLAYEDGDNSPLSQQVDQLLENDKIDFIWLKRKNRPREFVRSGILKSLVGHTDSISGVKILSDGGFLSYSDDYTLRLWNSDGSVRNVLKGHTGKINGVKILSDGRFLSYSSDYTLRLWTADGLALNVLKGHTGSINGVKVLSNGQLLSYSWDGSLRLWSDDGLLLNVLTDNDDAIGGVKMLSDGRFLSYSINGTLRLWSADGVPIKILLGHTDVIRGVEIFADDSFLSYSRDKTLRLWSSDGLLLRILEENSDLNKIEICKNGHFISSSRDATLCLWNKDGSLVKTLGGHAARINGIKELSDGRFLSYSDDHTLRLWNADGLQLNAYKQTYYDDNNILMVVSGRQLHTGAVKGVTILHDGRFLSYSEDKTMVLWSKDGSHGKIITGHTGAINGVKVLSDGRFLSYSEDKTLLLWCEDELPEDDIIIRYDSNIRWTKRLSNGKFLSFLKDDKLRLYSVNGKEFEELEGHEISINEVHMLSDGRFICSSWDTPLSLWSGDGLLLNILDITLHFFSIGNVKVNEFSDGRFSIYSGGYLSMWSAEGLELTNQNSAEHKYAKGHEILPNGKLLSYFDDHTIRLYDLYGKELKVLKGHSHIQGVRILLDGRFLSYAWDGTLRLWTQGGEELNVLNSQNKSIAEVEVLSDGRFLSFPQVSITEYATDHVLELWSSDGFLIDEFHENFNILRKIQTLKGGKLFFYSNDHVLHFWSTKGKLEKQFISLSGVGTDFDQIDQTGVIIKDGFRLKIYDFFDGNQVTTLDNILN